jgi:putative ABC transport system permease protein
LTPTNVREAFALTRASVWLLSLFGTPALGLALVGINGVIACSVTERTREIGIRMALGAEGGHVLALVLMQAAALALVGVAIGLGSALILTRALSHLLYGVSATDPLTLVGAAALLVMLAVISSYLPARRASRVDPMIALRTE